jgi:hypothetical protein
MSGCDYVRFNKDKKELGPCGKEAETYRLYISMKTGKPLSRPTEYHLCPEHAEFIIGTFGETYVRKVPRRTP